MTEDNSKTTILLAAGGTGGHVFPAIATGEELKKRGFNVHFATDTRGEKYLKGRGFEYKIISSASPTGTVKQRIGAAYKLIWGMLQSGFYLGVIRPQVVVGFGGYPSFPPLLAAKINYIRSVLHEQNSVLGKANRFLAKYVKVVATSFPETKNAAKAKLVGNPVRAEITEKPYPAFDGKLNILITGGSQGAKLFAESLPDALLEFKDQITVTHQVRDNEIEAVTAKYQASGMEFEVKSFFDDMPQRLEKAHVVICRAGASTIFELAEIGRPAIFIPLATSAENHQFYNAESAVKLGGGWMLEEKSLNKESFSAMLAGLLENRQKLVEAAENIKKFSLKNAASNLADLISELAK